MLLKSQASAFVASQCASNSGPIASKHANRRAIFENSRTSSSFIGRPKTSRSHLLLRPPIVNPHQTSIQWLHATVPSVYSLGNMNSVRSSELISTAEAARQVGCTVQHLRLLIRNGVLKGTRVGRDWVLDRGDVANYVDRRYSAVRTESPQAGEPIETLFTEAELQSIVNVASVPQRSPLRYPGGKTWLIPYARLWLKSIAPLPKLLVEPFAGGASIGLTAGFENLASEVELVELDPDIAAMWRVCLNGELEALCRKITKFDFEVENVRAVIDSKPKREVDHAFQTIIKNRASRGGILAPGAGLVKNGEAGKGIASRWYPETIVNRIREINRRASRFRIKEMDGFEAIRARKDEIRTAFFVDPPYPKAGKRLYRFHCIDHRGLFTLLNEVKGSFLITYDQSPEIESLAIEFGFEHDVVPMKSTHHEHKFEILISRDLSWLPSRTAA